MQKIKIIALVGEAGSGKDTLLQTLVEINEPGTFHEILSSTTRPMREGELNGWNYNFLTDEQFMMAVQSGEMLEWTQFNGWFYGTEKADLFRNIPNIGVFNPAGIRSLLKNPELDVLPIYVRVPAKERLIRQLNRETNPNINEIIRRYQTDLQDFQYLEFDYEIVDNMKAPTEVAVSLMDKIDQFIKR